MTGRKGRVVAREGTGEVEYELRTADTDITLELMNMAEKEKFMRGEKLVAIISEAASSGISLQAIFQMRKLDEYFPFSLINDHKIVDVVFISLWNCHGQLIKQSNNSVNFKIII
jgi:hypothetical protein